MSSISSKNSTRYCIICKTDLKCKEIFYKSDTCGHPICCECFELIKCAVTCFESSCCKKIPKEEWKEQRQFSTKKPCNAHRINKLSKHVDNQEQKELQQFSTNKPCNAHRINKLSKHVDNQEQKEQQQFSTKTPCNTHRMNKLSKHVDNQEQKEQQQFNTKKQCNTHRMNKLSKHVDNQEQSYVRARTTYNPLAHKSRLTFLFDAKSNRKHASQLEELQHIWKTSEDKLSIDSLRERHTIKDPECPQQDEVGFCDIKVAKQEQTPFRYNIRGLPNVGMTCYANSIFQVLAQTPRLMQHLDCLINKFRLNKGTLTWKLLDVLKDINIEMEVENKYQWIHESVSYEKMRQLVSKVINSDNSFHIGRQNDSHSFMITLFNAIKSEIKAEGVLGLFEGTFISKFEYLPCKHIDVSETQMFSSLLVPVDEYVSRWDIKDGIHTLLEEEIFHNNTLPCQKCTITNKNTDTKKKMEFQHLPYILVLQLGKIRQQYRHLEKMHKVVYYRHILPVNELKPSMNKQQYYRLYGVTLHSGSLSGGHYTAYVRCNAVNGGEDQWYDCSDSYVQKMSKDRVLDDERAFLLFYHLEETADNIFF